MNLSFQREWIFDNIGFVLKYKVTHDQLMELVMRYGTYEQNELAKSEEYEYNVLLEIIWTLLDRCKERLALVRSKFHFFPLD